MPAPAVRAEIFALQPLLQLHEEGPQRFAAESACAPGSEPPDEIASVQNADLPIVARRPEIARNPRDVPIQGRSPHPPAVPPASGSAAICNRRTSGVTTAQVRYGASLLSISGLLKSAAPPILGTNMASVWDTCLKQTMNLSLGHRGSSSSIITAVYPVAHFPLGIGTMFRP